MKLFGNCRQTLVLPGTNFDGGTRKGPLPLGPAATREGVWLPAGCRAETGVRFSQTLCRGPECRSTLIVRLVGMYEAHPSHDFPRGRFRIMLNDHVIFEGILWFRTYGDYGGWPAFDFAAEPEWFLEKNDRLMVENLSDPANSDEASAFVLNQVEILERLQDSLEIIACPKYTPRDEPFLVKVFSAQPVKNAALEHGASLIYLGKQPVTLQAGDNDLWFTGREIAADQVIALRAGRRTARATVRQITWPVDAGQRIFVGLTNTIFPPTYTDDYLRLFQAEELGNLFVFWILPINQTSAIGQPMPTVQDWPRWAAACRESRIYHCVLDYSIYNPSLPDEYRFTVAALAAMVKQGGSYFLGEIIGESYDGVNQGKDLDSLEDKRIAALKAYDNYYLVSLHKKELARLGAPTSVISVEPSMNHRHVMAAGAEMAVVETCANWSMTIAAARGACKAYGKKIYGSWLPLQWFLGQPPQFTASARGRRFRAGLQQAFIAGSRFINVENGFFSSVLKDRMELEHPDIQALHGFLREFNQFVKAQPRRGEPLSPTGFVKGNLDGFGGYGAWGESEPGIPETEIRYLDLAYPGSCLPGLTERRRKWLTGTPHGQADFIPIEAPLEVLRQYRSLIFLGWNTMTDAIYHTLIEYVRGGGALLMRAAHARCNVKRHEPLRFFRDGDLSELFGVKLKGQRPEICLGAEIVRASACERYQLPQHKTYPFHPVDELYTDQILCKPCYLVESELDGCETLAVNPGTGHPVLTERALGQGQALLLHFWQEAAPAWKSVDKRVAPFVSDIVEAMLEGDEGFAGIKESDLIHYGAYPQPGGFQKLYAMNTNWAAPGQAEKAALKLGSARFPISIPEGEIRVFSCTPELALVPAGSMTFVSDIQATDAEARIGVVGRGTVRFTVYPVCFVPRQITLNGKAVAFQADPQTRIVTFDAALSGRQDTLSVSQGHV